MLPTVDVRRRKPPVLSFLLRMETLRRAAPTWPICEETLMIEPGRFASISRRATACAMKKAARTLRPMITS